MASMAGPATGREGSMGRHGLSERGFTLADMMLVLVMLTLLGVLGAPRLVAMRAATRGRTAVAELATVHALARASAVRYGRPAQLRIDAANRRFWVEVDTAIGGGRTDTIGTVHQIAWNGLTMTSTRSRLCFDRRGIPWTASPCEAGDVTVRFTQGSRVDSLTTTSLGKVLR